MSPAPPTRPDLSLVICTLDEAQSIGPVLREARTALAGLAYEIVVVDDSDDERTAAVVRAEAAADDRIRLLRRPGARGLATAAIAGWAASRGDRLAIMDGDGQHDVRLLPALAARLAEGQADIVVASRYVAAGTALAGTALAGTAGRGLSRGRHAMSRAATLATLGCLRVPIADPMSGFFVVSRAWFEAARPRLSGIGFKILVDLLLSGPRAPRVREIPAGLRPRVGGGSKLDTRVVIELAALLVEKRSFGLVPARFALFAAVGLTGVLVNLAALMAFGRGCRLPFWQAQGAAILTAMVWNFVLNNNLTFRERRLRGWGFAAGLAAFCASCGGGALLSEAVATALQHAGAAWTPAGAGGTVAAALWNYWSTARASWTTDPVSAAPADPAGLHRRLTSG